MADSTITPKPTTILTGDAAIAANKLGTASEAIDDVLHTTATGRISTAIGDSFYGINHRQQPGAIPINKDFFGLTFFTRPKLNLSSGNLRSSRQLAPLLTNNKDSMHRIIRCLLDVDIGVGRVKNRNLEDIGISSQFVDRQQAFIPILTNNLISMSGWPDVMVPFSSSQEGMYKESFSLADGITQNYGTYDISASFRNLPGDPITLMFLVWIHYMSLVYQGVMVPYPEMIVQNEVDYNTRIYRLVLDSTKTKVQKIAACGAAFPTNSPIGAAFNFESGRPIDNGNDQINIHFQCMGAIYQDDILVYEFNFTVQYFNDGMKDINRGSQYEIIDIANLGLFNNRGYPRINPDTYMLEWYVSKADYALMLPKLIVK